MDNALFLLAGELRSVAHLLHYVPYIATSTKDTEFFDSVIEVISCYLYFRSDEIFSKLSNFTDNGFDRTAVFGGAFSTECNDD
ncbi:MAG: hypothetical protein K2J08_12315 [Ruminococcus sp.]|nr:hypothetical protein [Ruminococcus sp.]